MSDTYEFLKSTTPQALENDTPYVSKKWNYISDINQGVYSGAGISLVQFDLSSIFNSSSLVDPAQMFLSIPLTYVAAYSQASAAIAVASGNIRGAWATCGLKQGFFQVVHGADLQVDGKTIEQFQPYTNALVSFKMLSQMSQDDYNAYGITLGMGSVLDNPISMRYSNLNSTVTSGAYGTAGAQGPIGGNGMNNSAPFAAPTGTGSVGDFGDQTAYGPQGTYAYNKGYFSRINRIVDTTACSLGTAITAAGQVSGLYSSPIYPGTLTSNPAVMTTTQCQNEFRGTFSLDSTNTYMQWNDIAIVRLSDIFDSMGKWPLAKKFNGLLRLYLNTGACGAQMLSTGTTSPTVFSATTSTFVNTCPLLISNLTLPASSGATALVAGLFIARAQTTSIFGVNLGLSNSANPQTSCRLYFPQVELKALTMDRYISENRSKKVVWRASLFNQFSNITTGSSFSGLVQSGVSNIEGVLILPFISASTHGLLSGGGATSQITGIVPFSQLISPFDTAPATSAPISLTNLQVMVGGQNVLQNVLFYNFENFLEQVSLFDKINRTDFGLSCGLLNQYTWEQSRQYYVDCSRGQNADLMTPRNVNISFTNNSSQTIDCLIFTLYQDSCIIDTETGAVSGR